VGEEGMKRDDVIRMARKWGDWNGQTVEFNDVGLELFANLVAAAEREACAKVCEEWGATTKMEQGRLAGNRCAAAIRARSNP
jgi:hypothetical protein